MASSSSWNRLLCLSLAVVALLPVGCGGDEPGSWREPRVLAIDTLELSVAGALPPGRWELVVEEAGEAAGEPWRQPLGPPTSMGEMGASWVVSLRRPLLESAVVRVANLDGGGVAGAWTVDPGTAVVRFLEPLGSLVGKRLQGLLAAVETLRVDEVRSADEPVEAAVRARRRLAELLEGVGLDRPWCAAARILVDDLPRRGVGPGDSSAECLLPLWLVEAVLVSREGTLAPWGSVPEALGVRVSSRQRAEPPQGWRWLGRADTVARVPYPPDPAFSMELETWLAPPSLVAALTGGSGGGAAMGLLRLSRPVEVAPSEYRTSFVWDAALAKPTGRVARLHLVTTLFTRAMVLHVKVGSGPVIVLPSPVALAAWNPLASSYDTFDVSLPIRTSWLAPEGPTRVLLEAHAMPHDEPPVPMRLRELAVAAPVHGGGGARVR